jgi:hypothetical protein
MEILYDYNSKYQLEKPILQMSIPSSGGSLVSSILKEFFENVIYVKMIDESFLSKNAYKIITYRDPRSVLYSMCYNDYKRNIDFYGNVFKINEGMINKFLPEVLKCFNILNMYSNIKYIFDVYFLKYEEFKNNYDKIFSIVSEMNEEIIIEDSNKLVIIDKVKRNKSTPSYNLLCGEEVKDEWKEKIPRKYHDLINSYLCIPINEWGYDTENISYTNFY